MNQHVTCVEMHKQNIQQPKLPNDHSNSTFYKQNKAYSSMSMTCITRVTKNQNHFKNVENQEHSKSLTVVIIILGKNIIIDAFCRYLGI